MVRRRLAVVALAAAALPLSAVALGARVTPPVAEVQLKSRSNIVVRVVAPAGAIVRAPEHGVALGDTLIVRTPATLAVRLDAGDVRFHSASWRSFSLDATLTDALATKMSASGRRIVLRTGGREVRTGDVR